MQSIAEEVLAALQEAGREVGNGPLTFAFTRSTGTKPWDAAGAQGYTLTGIDQGQREVYVAGSAATRMARMLMLDATGETPKVGDKVSIAGKVHDVLAVMPFAPAGVALYHEVEISS